MNRHFYHDLKRILKYANTNFRKKINVDDIAKHAGYTSWHCNLLFQEYYGERLGEYLTSLRMKEAKRLLDSGLPVGRVAKTLNYSPRGLLKAFRGCFGVSPSEYVKTGKTLERYVQTYEWNFSEDNWGKGCNPTHDGLWEFAYYNPKTKEYGLMEWDAKGNYFQAPLPEKDYYMHPNWCCRNRDKGDGMHPGRATHAVRTFLCPDSGTVEVFFSVGRLKKMRPCDTPCALQLWHDDNPLDEPLVLIDSHVHYVTATVQVQKGDRIRLHLDPMGNHVADGIWLYRQKIGYAHVSEPYENNRIPDGVRSDI